MMSLPLPLGDGALRIWRLDRDRHAPNWHTGEGSRIAGGRWNSAGRRAIYASLDPSTAILEVAVHKGFRVLDTTAHVLTHATVLETDGVRVVARDEVPNPDWLVPGIPSSGQQAFGDALLADHPIVLVPSVVSRHSWNAIMDPGPGAALLADVMQERFALDPRLHAS